MPVCWGHNVNPVLVYNLVESVQMVKFEGAMVWITTNYIKPVRESWKFLFYKF